MEILQALLNNDIFTLKMSPEIIILIYIAWTQHKRLNNAEKAIEKTEQVLEAAVEDISQNRADLKRETAVLHEIRGAVHAGGNDR